MEEGNSASIAFAVVWRSVHQSLRGCLAYRAPVGMVGGDVSTIGVPQFNVGGSKKHLLDACSKWIENFDT